MKTEVNFEVCSKVRHSTDVIAIRNGTENGVLKNNFSHSWKKCGSCVSKACISQFEGIHHLFPFENCFLFTSLDSLGSFPMLVPSARAGLES